MSKSKKKLKSKPKKAHRCFLCECDAVGSVEQYKFCSGHLPWAKSVIGSYHMTFHNLMSKIQCLYKGVN